MTTLIVGWYGEHEVKGKKEYHITDTYGDHELQLGRAMQWYITEGEITEILAYYHKLAAPSHVEKIIKVYQDAEQSREG